MAAPERVRWAVELLDPSPGERILELGCGPGVAAALVCGRLGGEGRYLGVDRSDKAIERTRGRLAAQLDTGLATLRRATIAELGGPDAPAPGEAAFDKAFAVNVNVFWTDPEGPEAAILRDLLRPGGSLLLVYEGPGNGRDVYGTIGPALTTAGFRPEPITGPHPGLLAVRAARADR